MNSPDATLEQAADELARETQQHEALNNVLHIGSRWVRQTEEGFADTGDLVWRLEQAGHPLPDDGAP